MQSLSYAQTVKGNSLSHSFESKTRRPNCLNFRHKQIMKRQEAITFLKQLQYSILKLTGVAEMKAGTIDVTCKTRKDVLELHDILQKVDAVAFVKLYEQDNVNVVVGWVPIPMPNERIKSAFQNAFGPVIKVLQRKCRDGLVSGVRILIMQKDVLEKNPIPSYFKIDGNELYVTYEGQKFTCKYCGEIGHKQVDCDKRAQNFPSLQRDENIIQNSSPDQLQTDAFPSKKRKKNTEIRKANKFRTEAAVDLSCAAGSLCFNTSNKPLDLSQPEQLSKEQMEVDVSADKTHVPKDWWERGSSIICQSCKSENILVNPESHFICWNCHNDNLIAKPCCASEDNADSYRSVCPNTTKFPCPACTVEMLYLSCCESFVPVNKIDDENIIQCGKCNKLFMECNCESYNQLPGQGLAFCCKNVKCHYKTVHCDCSRKSVQLFTGTTPYLCECGCEFEYDIDMGVTKMY